MITLQPEPVVGELWDHRYYFAGFPTLARFELTEVTSIAIKGRGLDFAAGAGLLVSTPAELNQNFRRCPIQRGEKWTQPPGSNVFRLGDTAWDERDLVWMWEMRFHSGVPGVAGPTMKRSEQFIRETCCLAPAAPQAAARKGNHKCGCGSDAFLLFNAIECFNPKCPSYVPEKR